MFDLFRSRERSVRILLGALLVLVAASMLVYLIPGGPGGTSGGNDNVIATVGGDAITAQDLQRAVQRITRGQANLPRAVLAMYVPSLVDQLIEEKAMAYKARQVGLRVSDQELGDAIQTEFSSQLGGKFDMNIYKAVLAEQGMTAPDYENTRREAMLAMRLESLEMQSLVVSDEDAKAEYQRKNLKIGLEYLAFEDKAFESKVKKDPAALKAYFDKNRSLFRTLEKRDFNLIVGTTADFVSKANISDDQLRKQYQDEIDSYRVPERVKVRHILIKTQGKPKDEAPKLKAKAEGILDQLKHGADFADLAKKDSEDPGSGSKGGELGWIVRGQTVPAFEKSAFSLKPGELSGIIETEYGYHIIQVEEKQPGHTQSFEEVRPQLLASAQKEAGTQDLQKAMSAAHAEIQRNPSQADEIAKKYNVRIFKLSGFKSGDVLPEVGTNPEVLNAVNSTAKGAVSKVVDLENQGKSAFAVVTNIVAAHNADYADVQKDVEQRYVTMEASRLAHEAADAAAQRARKGESLESIAKSYGLTVKTAAPFTISGAAEGIGSASLFSNAFKGKAGDIVGPVVAQSGQFVCKVSDRIPADMSQYAKNRDDIVQQLMSQKQSIDAPLFRESVVDDLKHRGKIKVNQPNIDRIISSYQS